MTRLLRALGAPLVVAVLAGAALTGCSGDDSSDSSTPGGSGSTSATPYLAVPSDVRLTPPGSQLHVGDSATVAFRPRQQEIGVLDVTVTRLERTTFKQSFSGWQLDAATKRSSPYFVHARVKNVGDTDLAGRTVPLYGVDQDDVLLQPTTFQSEFKPCPSTPLPKPFGKGRTARVCLVYLAPDHGDLTGVSFALPDENGVAPITWTGKLQQPRSAHAGGKSGKKSGSNSGTKAGGKKQGGGKH